MTWGLRNPGMRRPHWNWDRSRNEQRLFTSLANEAAQLFGVECVYVARNFTGFDQLYGTTESESYTYTWTLPMVQRYVMGFSGDREFMSKVAGLEIRDQLVFSVPIKSFELIVGHDARFPSPPPGFPGPALRPREGDLIWYPYNKKCFKIMFVNKTDMFWQFGKLFTWEVTAELFEYSGEQFNTGIPDIDRIQVAGSLNIYDWAMTDTDSKMLAFDPTGDIWVVDKFANVYPLADNLVIDTEANNYIDWNTTNLDPFADANNQGGTI